MHESEEPPVSEGIVGVLPLTEVAYRWAVVLSDEHGRRYTRLPGYDEEGLSMPLAAWIDVRQMFPSREEAVETLIEHEDMHARALRDGWVLMKVTSETVGVAGQLQRRPS